MWILTGLLALIPPAALAAQASAPRGPAEAGLADENTTDLVVHAKRAFIRPGTLVEGVSILVRGGRIVGIGENLEAPGGAQVLDAEVVCAGFLDPWSALGLPADVRQDRTASPATRAIDGFDAWSEEKLRLETLRAGITSVRVQAGNSSRTGGVGSVVRVAPSLPASESVVAPEACFAMNLGLSANAGGGQGVEIVDNQPVLVDTRNRPMDVFDRLADLDRVLAALEGGRTYLYAKVEHRHELEEWQKKIREKETELEKDFKKAKKDREKEEKDAKDKGKPFEEKKYKEDKKPQAPRFDEDNEVLARTADGELAFFVQAHRAAEVRGLLQGTRTFDRLRMVLVGGSEARTSAKELSERGVAVLVWPALRGKGAQDEYEGADPSLPGDLARSGVRILLGSGGTDPAASRDLPILAQLAIGHGLDRDAALEALTIGAARALDVADRIGTIEIGKDADLLLLTGDPLDAGTRVERVVSAGRVVLNPED